MTNQINPAPSTAYGVGSSKSIATECELISAARQHLKDAHPELLAALLASDALNGPTIEVKGLPLHSQRMVWRLYARHYPDLARWIEEMDMEAWREQFGATLKLQAQDILRALDREYQGEIRKYVTAGSAEQPHGGP